MHTLNGARVVPGRLGDGFGCGPRIDVRGDGAAGGNWRVLAAAAEVRSRTATLETADTLAAVGVASLAVGERDKGIELLAKAAANQAASPSVLSDLAAAHQSRADADDRFDDAARAYEWSRRALALEPRMPEGLFNLALALETLGLAHAARAAWQDYLQVDSSSACAVEARRHLALASEPASWERWDRETRQQLIESASSGHDDVVRTIVRQYPLAAREYVEDITLGSWAQAQIDGQPTTANQHLAFAQRVADAVAATTGDRLLGDTIARIKLASPMESRGLALGHRAFGSARSAYTRQALNTARPAFREAARHLEDARSPFLAWVQFYLEVMNYHDGRLGEASDALTRLASSWDETHYPSLSGRVHWMLGLIAQGQSKFDSALTEYRRAAACFRRTSEREHAIFVQLLLYETYESVGEPGIALGHLQRTLRQADQFRSPLRRLSVMLAAADEASTLNLRATAVLLADRALEEARLAGSEPALVTAYLQVAMAHDDDAAALASLRRGISELRGIEDRGLRDRLEAETDVRVARVAPSVSDRILAFQKAIQYFAAYDSDSSRLPELYLNLAQAHGKNGMLENAADVLRTGIEASERHGLRLASPEARRGYRTRQTALYREMVGLELRRERPAAALEWLDRSRDPDPSLRSRAGQWWKRTDVPATLVSYASMSDRLGIWVLGGSGLTYREVAIGRDAVEAAVGAFATALRDGDQTAELNRLSSVLHRLLITPIADLLQRNRPVVVVPDGPLGAVPFAALHDGVTKRYLIQDHTVVSALSAARYFYRDRGAPARTSPLRALVVALPSALETTLGNVPALPNAGREAQDVSALYGPRATVLADAKATPAAVLQALSTVDVFHYGGHAVANSRAPDFSRLVLADGAERGKGQVVFVHDLTRRSFDNLSLVVLAACRTAAGPISDSEGVASLARPFLVGGASSVVATYWDVDDRHSRSLMAQFHREYLSRRDAAEALRAAQLRAISAPTESERSPTMWAAFAAFGSAT